MKQGNGKRSSRSSRRIGFMVGAGILLGVASYQLASSKAGILSSTTIAAPNEAAMGELISGGDNQVAPDFALKDVNGNTVHLSDYRGKVVVLNFWATWCPPCRKEIPDFMDLQKTYGDQGVQFLGVSLDEGGLPTVQNFLKSNPITYPILIGEKAMVAKYGEMNAIPVTYFIDRKGVIRNHYVAMRPKQVIESTIAPLLSEK